MQLDLLHSWHQFLYYNWIACDYYALSTQLSGPNLAKGFKEEESIKTKTCLLVADEALIWLTDFPSGGVWKWQDLIGLGQM